MSFSDVKKIWMNGKIMDWQDAKIHVMSHVIHYGTGVFEGIRCYNTVRGSAIFRLDAHLRRMCDSAHVYMMEMPYSREEITSAIFELIQANGFKDCYIRPIVYYGYDTLGVHPKKCPIEMAIAVWPWGAYLGEGGLEKGIRVTISPWTKYHSSMLPTVAKACGQYLNSYLSVREAQNKGFQEAVLLDREGDISEGSGENVFVVRGGRIYTNDPSSSILLGITRGAVIQIAKDLGYDVTIRKLSRGELFISDEIFFTGTAAEVTPVVEVDNRRVGSGMRGPVTKAIQDRFFEIVQGKRAEYDDWLTFIK